MKSGPIIFVAVVMALLAFYIIKIANVQEESNIPIEQQFPTLGKPSSGGWEKVLDSAVDVGANSAYSNFEITQGGRTQLHYTVESDLPLNVYWVKSKSDCNAAVKGGVFTYYSSCAPQNKSIYNFSSSECSVPSNSGLCAINPATSAAKVHILIEKKT